MILTPKKLKPQTKWNKPYCISTRFQWRAGGGSKQGPAHSSVSLRKDQTKGPLLLWRPLPEQAWYYLFSPEKPFFPPNERKVWQDNLLVALIQILTLNVSGTLSWTRWRWLNSLIHTCLGNKNTNNGVFVAEREWVRKIKSKDGLKSEGTRERNKGMKKEEEEDK